MTHRPKIFYEYEKVKNTGPFLIFNNYRFRSKNKKYVNGNKENGILSSADFVCSKTKCKMVIKVKWFEDQNKERLWRIIEIRNNHSINGHIHESNYSNNERQRRGLIENVILKCEHTSGTPRDVFQQHLRENIHIADIIYGFENIKSKVYRLSLIHI